MKPHGTRSIRARNALSLASVIGLLAIANCGTHASEEVASKGASRANGRRSHPEVWLCAGDRIADLLDSEAEWPFVKQHLTGIKFYIGQLYGPRGESADVTMDRLRQSVRLTPAARLHKFATLGSTVFSVECPHPRSERRSTRGIRIHWWDLVTVNSSNRGNGNRRGGRQTVPELPILGL
jgi:hypothetical protein